MCEVVGKQNTEAYLVCIFLLMFICGVLFMNKMPIDIVVNFLPALHLVYYCIAIRALVYIIWS